VSSSTELFMCSQVFTPRVPCG